MSNTAAVFLVSGFEEVEAVATIDMLRRGGVDTTTVSLTGEIMVEGSHGISIKADVLFENISNTEYDAVVLPGGPGTANYKQHEAFLSYLEQAHGQGKVMAAICAAPSVFGMLGFLKGKKAVCFPGFEDELIGAEVGVSAVVRDGRIITSRSAATAVCFGIEIVDALNGVESAAAVDDGILNPLVTGREYWRAK